MSAEVPQYVPPQLDLRPMPTLSLEIITSANFQEAERLESQGLWSEAANHYFSVFSNESLPSHQRAVGLLGIAQMAINLGLHTQAQGLLDQMNTLTLAESDRPRLEAIRATKLGWIADDMGNFRQAAEFFLEARRNLPESDPAFSTATHFLARAYHGQGLITLARELFNQDLRLVAGKPAHIGFCLTWIAAGYLQEGDVTTAQDYLGRARAEFDQVQVPGIDISYWLMSGAIQLHENQIRMALDHYYHAWQLAIPDQGEFSPKEAAAAAFGIARCYSAVGETQLASQWINSALAAHPHILKRGSIGLV